MGASVTMPTHRQLTAEYIFYIGCDAIEVLHLFQQHFTSRINFLPDVVSVRPLA